MPGFRNSEDRAERIALDARVIGRLLQAYDGRDRIFALTEIVQLCRRELANRESSQYRLGPAGVDFATDEAPTNPDVPNNLSGPPDLGDRDTRRVNTDDMKDLIAKTKPRKP